MSGCIGKMLVAFVLAIAFVSGLGAFLQGTIPDNIWIYIIWVVIFFWLVNFIASLVSNNEDIVTELRQKTYVEFYKDGNTLIATSEGKTIQIIEKDRNSYHIYETDNGRRKGAPLMVEKKQLAQAIKSKFKPSKNYSKDLPGGDDYYGYY